MKETIKISGMSCNHCVKSVEAHLLPLKLKKFKVQINSLEVEYDETVVTKEQIVKAVEDTGYEVMENCVQVR
jgi:copper chaperone CopZ